MINKNKYVIISSLLFYVDVAVFFLLFYMYYSTMFKVRPFCW